MYICITGHIAQLVEPKALNLRGPGFESQYDDYNTMCVYDLAQLVKHVSPSDNDLFGVLVAYKKL